MSQGPLPGLKNISDSNKMNNIALLRRNSGQNLLVSGELSPKLMPSNDCGLIRKNFAGFYSSDENIYID